MEKFEGFHNFFRRCFILFVFKVIHSVCFFTKQHCDNAVLVRVDYKFTTSDFYKRASVKDVVLFGCQVISKREQVSKTLFCLAIKSRLAVGF